MPIYKRRERRNKGYSFDGGKVTLSQRQRGALETSAAQANKKLSGTPVEKAGLIPGQTEEKAQKGWQDLQKNIMDADGNIKMAQQQRDQGFAQTQDGGIDFSQPIDPSRMSPDQVKALQQQVGAKPDGKWGPGSQNQLNKYYAFQGIEPPNAKELKGVLQELGAVIKKKPDNYDTIGGKKPSYATDELSSGGDVSPELIATIKDNMGALKIPGLRITAGNDAYHQGDRYSRPGKERIQKVKL